MADSFGVEAKAINKRPKRKRKRKKPSSSSSSPYVYRSVKEVDSDGSKKKEQRKNGELCYMAIVDASSTSPGVIQPHQNIGTRTKPGPGQTRYPTAFCQVCGAPPYICLDIPRLFCCLFFSSPVDGKWAENDDEAN